jgi:hypothetical protein
VSGFAVGGEGKGGQHICEGDAAAKTAFNFEL